MAQISVLPTAGEVALSDKEKDASAASADYQDVPTSPYGAFIAYASVVQCIANLNGGAGASDDPWAQPEQEIRDKCEAGSLVALGIRPDELNLVEVPSTDWPRMWVSMVDGQPGDDHAKHGGRMYGIAYLVDPLDSDRTELAYRGLCFRKADVLQHWPELGPSNEKPEVSSKPGRRKGDGSFTTADELFLIEMHELLSTGKATSVREAADQVVKKPGNSVRGNSETAKINRLRRAYRKKFPRRR